MFPYAIVSIDIDSIDIYLVNEPAKFPFLFDHNPTTAGVLPSCRSLIYIYLYICVCVCVCLCVCVCVCVCVIS
jgi:hypothetical protein